MMWGIVGAIVLFFVFVGVLFGDTDYGDHL